MNGNNKERKKEKRRKKEKSKRVTVPNKQRGEMKKGGGAMSVFLAKFIDNGARNKDGKK